MTNNATASGDRRAARYRMHHWLQTNSVRLGARICMRSGATAAVVTVGVTAGGAVHLSGIKRCGSWTCTVCGPALGEGRAAEIDKGIGQALAEGLFVYFVTATVQHKLGDHLADVRGLVHGSWRSLFSGRCAAEWRASTGYVGMIRTGEETYGANGWHPHIHALLVFDRPQPGLGSLGQRYSTIVGSRGGRCDWRGAGWDWSRVTCAADVSGYVAKVEKGWGAGLELARSDLKSARRGGLQPFALLGMAVDGDSAAAGLWRVYESACIGRRKLLWSRGLKDRLGVNDVEDGELLDVEPADVIVYEVDVPARVWNRIRRKGDLARLLDEIALTAALRNIAGEVTSGRVAAASGSPPDEPSSRTLLCAG